MLKRIFTIALITGAGQLFVIFALKYISQNSSSEQVKAIGQIDSLILFIMNVIALGLQPAAMRNLALTEDWKQEYLSTQSARLTLGIFIASFALLAFTDQYYLAFLIAPLLALSGDYALYGRGFPVKGAIIAFARAVIPFLLIIFIIQKTTWPLHWIYFTGLLVVYLITNFFISLFLKPLRFPQVNIRGLKMYVNTLPLGLVSLGLYFIGMGVLLIAQYFYNDEVLATAFIGLKFYVIFKGVLRIIQQAFLREMIKEEVCLKIDQLSSLIGFTFLAFMISFPNTFISFFFGSKYVPEKNYFILIAASAFIYSLFSSFTTRAMLEKKDNQYAIVTFSAALFTLIVCIILSLFLKKSQSIGISVIVGEIFFTVGMLKLIGEYQMFKNRILFALKNSLFLIIPLITSFLFSRTLLSFLITFLVFITLLVAYHFNKFNTLPGNLETSKKNL